MAANMVKIKGSAKLKRRIAARLENIGDTGTKRALTKIGGVVLAKADQYAPMDTKALINSGFRVVEKSDVGYMLRVGYTQSYALPLHSPKPGSKMDGWKPMDPYEREWRTRSAKNFVGGGTGGYNPNAKQGWLSIGLQESKQAINKILIDEIKK